MAMTSYYLLHHSPMIND